MESLKHVTGIHPGISLQGFSLIYLYTDWCIPCAMMAPVLDNLSKSTNTTVIPVNIEKRPAEASIFEVYDIPTFILFKDAEVVWQHSGIISETTLREIVQSIQKTQ